jgi:hypothetical protein
VKISSRGEQTASSDEKDNITGNSSMQHGINVDSEDPSKPSKIFYELFCIGMPKIFQKTRLI